MFLVDSHCHLNLLDQDADQKIDDVLTRAQAADVRYFLNVSVSLASFPAILETACAYSFVAASLGSHPNEPEEVNAPQLIQLGQHEKVIAIGETGLDYFRTTEEQHRWQQQRFRAHIEAAKKLKKPLIIHTRAAKNETMQVMQTEAAYEVGGVMHCFTEEWEAAKQALDMNFYISLSGIVTFKNAATIQDVAKRVPLDRLLIETDSPYLAPHPLRGKPNEPAYLRYTAEYIATLRQIPLAQLAEQTTENFFTLFKGATRPHV